MSASTMSQPYSESESHYCNIDTPEIIAKRQSPGDGPKYSVSQKRKKPLSSGPRDELSFSDTEHTYLQPNSVMPVEKPDDEIDVKSDPELLLVASLVNGDIENIQTLLKDFSTSDPCLFKQIDIKKVPDSGMTDLNHLLSISPIDLALHLHKEVVIKTLIEFGQSTLPNFSELLISHHHLCSAKLLDHLSKNFPDLAKQLLDSKVEQDNQAVNMDFSVFQNTLNQSSQTEMNPVLTMLKFSRMDLFFHPVTESLVRLKWKKCRKFFLVDLSITFAFALVFAIAVIFEYQRSPAIALWNTEWPNTSLGLTWMSFTLCLFLLIQMICKLITNSSWKLFQDLEMCLALTLFTNFMLYLSLPGYFEANLHFGVWTILNSWALFLMKVGKYPSLPGFLVQILRWNLWDLVKFFICIVPLLFAFSVALHLLYPTSASLQNPIGSFLVILAMMVGHFETSKTSSLFAQDETIFHGTSQLVIILFLFLVTIGIINMSIAISVIRIRDSLPFIQKFKLVQKVLISNEIEEQLVKTSDLLSKLKFARLNLSKCSQLLRSENHLKVTLQYQKDNKSRVTFHKSNETFASCNVTFINLDDDGTLELAGFVPTKIFENCQDILEKNAMKASLSILKTELEQSGEAQGTENPYTNLDWASSVYNYSEPEYEPINDASKTTQNYSSIFKSMRESLLRELRRDFGKLGKIGGSDLSLAGKEDVKDKQSVPALPARGDPANNAKFVNVRPGLALGLITLHAGTQISLN